MSQQQTRPTPPPKAAPLTRAMVGFGSALSVAISSASLSASSQILGLAKAGHGAHPLDVGAAQKGATGAGQDHHPHVVARGSIDQASG